VYTNTIAKIALSAPYTMSSYLGLKSDHMKNWLAMANKTYIPFDEARKFHPEYDGYKIGKNVSFICTNVDWAVHCINTGDK
jgi:trehalose/maltose hydrolase-like predicted phosphorylase